jgi:cupin domain
MNVGPQLVDRGGDICASGPSRSRMMLLMRIDRWDVGRDGPLSDGALRRKLDVLGCVGDSWRYSAGTIAPGRPDNNERIHAVVSGLIKITVDGASAILTAGDGVYVPSGSSRQLDVVGTSTALCLEGVYHRRPS